MLRSHRVQFHPRPGVRLNACLNVRDWAIHSARFVLLWFALSLGVAIASPLIKPQAMELICTSAGATKLLVKTDEGVKEVSGHTLECPLCATLSAPPPVAHLTAEPAQPLGYVLQSIPAAHVAARTAAPLPARGPPALS
jgi:hypothetical protein